MELPKFADLEGVRLAYHDLMPEGDAARTVVLLHGFASNARVNWIGTGWTKVLLDAGYRVIAPDNRGHGESEKFHRSQDYGPDIFAADTLKLLNELSVTTFDTIGFSMGSRIASWLAWKEPEQVHRAVFGGMGSHIFGGRGGYEKIAEGLVADDPSTIKDATALAFRHFADRTGSDRLALAACIQPARQRITPEMIGEIRVPVLVAVGSDDDIGGSAEDLAGMMANAVAFTMPGLDHLRTTGATVFKNRTLEFLNGNDGP